MRPYSFVHLSSSLEITFLRIVIYNSCIFDLAESVGHIVIGANVNIMARNSWIVMALTVGTKPEIMHFINSSTHFYTSSSVAYI